MTYTSNEAHKAIKPVKPAIKAVVIEAVQSAGKDGTIVSDLVTRTGIRENSLRPRLSELQKAGKLIQNGTRRNERGRPEQVWIAA